MNTQNNKFTFNKKSFALSLACVGLLATAGNAEITGGSSAVGLNGATDGTSYFLGNASVGLGGIYNVTGTNDSLTFYSGAGVANVAQTSGATIQGTGSITNLNLYNISGSVTISSGSAINLNSNIANINVGTSAGASGAVIFSGAGSINLGGSATFGTVNLNNIQVVKGSTASLSNAGNVTSLKLNSGIAFAGDSAASFGITNSGLIANFDIADGVVVGGTVKKGSAYEFTVQNTGTITNFKNAGTLQAFTDSAGTAIPGVTITNNGLINSFVNETTGLLDNVNISQNADTASNLTAGTIAAFDNKGRIQASTISGGVISAFTNSGTITGSTLQGIAFTDFTNSGTIDASILSGGITITNFSNTNASADNIAKITNSTVAVTIDGSFKNSGEIISGAGAITFNLAGVERAPTLTAVNENTGTIVGATFNVSDQIQSFSNAGTILDSRISGGGTIQSFTNTGKIGSNVVSGSTIQNLSITTLDNSGEISNTVLHSLKIDTFNNSGVVTTNSYLSGSSITTLNNSGTFDVFLNGNGNAITTLNNVSTGEVNLKSGTGTEISFTNITNDGYLHFDSAVKLNIQGNGSVASTASATGSVMNTGTIIGNNSTTGSLSGGTIQFNNHVASFTNTATGVIDAVTLSTAADTDILASFDNAGTITNASATLNVTNFKNTGEIDFGVSGALTLAAKTTTANTSATFNNSGVIQDLTGITAKASYVDFDNSGTILLAETTAPSNLLTASGGNVNFNNSGVITLFGGEAIRSTTSGSRISIVNTGEVRLNTRSGTHINLDNFAANAGVTIKQWNLVGIADGGRLTEGGYVQGEFNETGNANLTDKIVVSGYTSIVERSGATTSTIGSGGTTTGSTILGYTPQNVLKLETGSLVIDPLKNQGMVAGHTYDLDKIVVNANGAGVELLNPTRGSGSTILDAVNDAVSKGLTDPRLVTINTLTSTDPMFVIQGVDKYDENGYLVGIDDVDTEITTPITNPDGSSGSSTSWTTRKAVGDGVIDAFTIGVDASRSVGAVAMKSAVTQTITRNAFVNNIVQTAVNTALTELNPLNRISLNSDGEVDVSKLEKFAQVSSDGAGYSYNNDTQVYVMPYYRHTSVDVERGGSLDGESFGIVVGGQKVIPGNGGVLGLFVGYETGDAGSGSVDTEDDAIFGGINYYKVIGGASNYDYYLKGLARVASISSDVTSKEIGSTGSASSADSLTYGVEGAVGLNYYSGIHTFTPEFALSYDKVSLDSFDDTRSSGTINYDETSANLLMARLGVNWFAQISNAVSTNLGVGLRYSFNDEFDSKVAVSNFGSFLTKTTFDDLFYYVTAGINLDLTPNWSLAVIYTGDFASESSANSGFFKVGYSW